MSNHSEKLIMKTNEINYELISDSDSYYDEIEMYMENNIKNKKIKISNNIKCW